MLPNKVMGRATSEAKAAMDAAVREATARAAGEVRAAEKARAAVELEAMRAAGARRGRAPGQERAFVGMWTPGSGYV